MDTTKLEYRICKGFKRFLFVSCRFPAFKDEYIVRNIDKPTTSKDDLECYRSSCTSTGRKRALFLVILYTTYCFKNAYIPYQAFSTLDYENLESNIKTHPVIYDQSYNSKNSTSLKSFACLWTNCSRLSATTPYDASMTEDHSTNHYYSHHERPSTMGALAHDVIVLPLFALCSPIAEVLYTPAIKLDSLGVLISTAACLNVLLLGAYTTIQQFIAPAPNEMIMFICAPTVTTQITRSRAQQLFFDLVASFHNFRFKPVWKRKRPDSVRRIQAQWEPTWVYERYPSSVVLSDDPLSGSTSNISGFNDINDGQSLRIRALIGQTDSIRHSEQLLGSELGTRLTMKRNNLSFEGKTQEEIQTITNSCLPIIRTEWYRAYSARIFNHTLLVTVSLIGFVGLGVFSFIAYRTHIKSHELRLAAREIERQNCTLWRGLSSSDTGDVAVSMQSFTGIGEVIELDRVNFGWTWLAMLLGFVNLVPGFTVAILFAYYWACLAEFRIWLAELRMFLVASLVVAKFKMSPTHNLLGLSRDAGEFAGRPRCSSHDKHRSDSPPDQLAVARLPWSPDVMRKPLRGLSGREQITIYDSGDSEEDESASSSSGWWSTSCLLAHYIQTDHFYNMKLLRENFQSELRFMHLTFLSRIKKDDDHHETGPMNSRKIDRYNFKQFLDKLFHLHTRCDQNKVGEAPSRRATRLYSGPLPLRYDFKSELECMEQIYINSRLFVEHVHNCSPSIKVVVAITYLLNYGLVLISILCSRKMSTLKTEPICLIVFGLFISNSLILLAANFHAEAKKLQPLLWSIIAQLNHSDNLRVQHMRFLWTKQAQMLDDLGGLALSAFRLRVTYVNIIQLALGTVTIIVISIRQN